MFYHINLFVGCGAEVINISFLHYSGFFSHFANLSLIQFIHFSLLEICMNNMHSLLMETTADEAAVKKIINFG
jgi:hypothetical protein